MVDIGEIDDQMIKEVKSCEVYWICMINAGEMPSVFVGPVQTGNGGLTEIHDFLWALTGPYALLIDRLWPHW